MLPNLTRLKIKNQREYTMRKRLATLMAVVVGCYYGLNDKLINEL